jgi:hypothetical protein
MKYYNPEKILNMKDLDDEEPSIYMITTNRSAGKTTAFLKKALEDFKKDGSQTVLMYRYQYELNAAADIFKDVLNMNFELGAEMKVASCAHGLFYQLFLDDKPFGFSVSLSNPDSLKKYSPVFADVNNIIFDEFQCETGRYLPKEIEKFQSIYLTIARGGGEQSRNVKVFMLGNMVTIMNPYFINFGVHKRLKDNTNFMRGNGWVAEFGFNASASSAIKSHGFFKAFAKEDYMNYSTEKVYLHDASVFIDKPKGRFKYICTIVHDSISYGVREYFDEGIIYVSHKPDGSCHNVIAFKASDHNQNTIMLSHYSYLWKNIRDAFNNGYLRFDDMRAKSAIFDILSVDIYK